MPEPSTEFRCRFQFSKGDHVADKHRGARLKVTGQECPSIDFTKRKSLSFVRAYSSVKDWLTLSKAFLAIVKLLGYPIYQTGFFLRTATSF